MHFECPSKGYEDKCKSENKKKYIPEVGDFSYSYTKGAKEAYFAAPFNWLTFKIMAVSCSKDKRIREEMESKSKNKQPKANKKQAVPITEEKKAENFESAYQDLLNELNRMEATHFANFPDFRDFIDALKDIPEQ